ncbi:MAG: Gfo/Idh/MocA family oxidoreductase [Armatimonadota bacterium]
MLRIGFVDHHLNNFHANKFLTLLRGPLADLDGRVVAAWESNPSGDEDWCEKHGVTRAESAVEVAAACDAVMVLAPDNIEMHLALCREVLPSGTPCFIDKFLAPTLGEAQKIIEMAEEYDAWLFSASALRFAEELQESMSKARSAPSEAFARGMGDWDNYGVHTLSLVLGCMGPGIRRVLDTGKGGSTALTLEYEDGRRAWVDVREAENQWEALPWSFGFRDGEQYVTQTIKDFDGFYCNLMRRALHAFRTGRSVVSTQEMLRVVAILEAAGLSRAADGAWIELPV